MATLRYSIYYSFQSVRRPGTVFPARPPKDWRATIQFMRNSWEHDDDTILETYFYEPFKPNGGNPYLPDFMKGE
jgi:hypothetical protein